MFVYSHNSHHSNYQRTKDSLQEVFRDFGGSPHERSCPVIVVSSSFLLHVVLERLTDVGVKIAGLVMAIMRRATSCIAETMSLSLLDRFVSGLFG